MSTVTRKQREIEEREARILQVARTMLLEQGYHGLNMDRIAQELEYSKGTIYNHFSCKEEIIIALVIETMTKRTSMFERAAKFSGRTRDRILAIGVAFELFVQRYPEHYQVEKLVQSSSIWQKCSEDRRTQMGGCEFRCMSIVAGIAKEAIEAGDLQLDPGITPEEMVFGLWSITNGAYSVMATAFSLPDVGLCDPLKALRTNQHRLLDGFGWKPLSSEFDNDEMVQRIKAEVFSDEV